MTTLEKNRTSFETRQLGNSDLKLTPIGFGAWAIGGGNWDFGWGAQDDRESVDAIVRALDAANGPPEAAGHDGGETWPAFAEVLSPGEAGRRVRHVAERGYIRG